jgi:hypothetical protein
MDIRTDCRSLRNYEARGSALSVMAFSEVGTLLAPARILVRGAIMIRFGSWSAPSCRGLKSDSMDIVSLSLQLSSRDG